MVPSEYLLSLQVTSRRLLPSPAESLYDEEGKDSFDKHIDY